LCTPEQDSRASLYSEQIRQYTQAAMIIFDDPTHPITIWGYSSAFNPLAFVETILPPNFHYLLQSGQFLIDPTRTVLAQAPTFFDLNSESAQLKVLAAYGHPNRWLKSSRDLKRYLYDHSSAIPCPADRVFHQHIPLTPTATTRASSPTAIFESRLHPTKPRLQRHYQRWREPPPSLERPSATAARALARWQQTYRPT